MVYNPKRYILSGTPGSGKTSLIRLLEDKNFFVVEEAATDIILLEQMLGCDEPWSQASFIDKIINLQKRRQLIANFIPSSIQFFDRSPLCTCALAKYLDFKISDKLKRELERIEKNSIYEKRVFFIENLGFVQKTNARKISLEEALKFEKIHKQIYSEFNYELICIPADNIEKRLIKVVNEINKNNKEQINSENDFICSND